MSHRFVLFALVALLAVTAVASAGSTSVPLPPACSLLSRGEAEQLASIRLQPASDGGDSCIYNSYPTDTSASVQIFVGNDVPRAMRVDRALHHAFRKVSGLGDEAYEEQWNVFARKGTVWVFINLVRLDDWAKYRQPLERAAALALSRVGAAGASASAAPAGPPKVVGRAPAGAGSPSKLWRGRERRFGGSITPTKGVVYQPDVVLIGGGANAVRSVSPDGLTWTIDGRAPGVSRLRVGRIMLATSLAAGRVLALSHEGPNVKVTVGPAGLTDIVRDGDFESHGPVAIAHPLYYSATIPQAAPKGMRTTQGVSAAQAGPGTFTTTPICCDGIGVQLAYDNGEGRMQTAVYLYVKKPTVSFSIRVGGGKLLEASVKLHTGGGIHYQILGATREISGNVNSGELQVPGVLVIPLGGALSLSISQSFDTSMQLSGSAFLKADGEYSMTGDLGFTVGGGGARADAVTMATHYSLLRHEKSVGLGLNAFKLGWNLKATVGLGLGVGSAGAWYALSAGLALAGDASPASLHPGCNQESLDVTGKFGVGFTMPEFVRSVVNFILRAVRAKPIPPTIGPSWGPQNIWNPPLAEYCPPIGGR